MMVVQAPVVAISSDTSCPTASEYRELGPPKEKENEEEGEEDEDADDEAEAANEADSIGNAAEKVEGYESQEVAVAGVVTDEDDNNWCDIM